MRLILVLLLALSGAAHAQQTEKAAFAMGCFWCAEEAFENLANGPTWMVGDQMRAAAQMLGSMGRNEAVRLISAASAASMGSS